MAGALLSKSGGKLHILHSYHTPMVDPNQGYHGIDDALNEIRKNAQDGLESLKGQAEALLKLQDVEVIAHLDMGLAVDVISDYSKQNNIDLIVMGTSGADGIEEALIGTITAEVMDRSTVPVLGVPLSSKSNNLSRIAYATDFNKLDNNAVERLLKIVGVFDFHLCLVHVEPLESEEEESRLMGWYKGEMQKLAGDKRISFHYEIAESVEKGLERFIEKENIGILAMLMRHRSLWDRIIQTSHTKKMAYHSKVPVLAMHE